MSTRQLRHVSAFISYSSHDSVFAGRLRDSLASHGLRCWQAPDDLRIGGDLSEGIRDAIAKNTYTVLILSESSTRSDWVREEVGIALRKERETGRRVLLPIRIDNTDLQSTGGSFTEICQTRQLEDFRDWTNALTYERSFEHFLADFQAEAETGLSGQVTFECPRSVVYTDYMLWAPEGVTNKMPVLLRGPKETLNQCAVFVDGYEIESVSQASSILTLVGFERVLDATKRGTMLVEARKRRSREVLARTVIDVVRTPWHLLPRINTPDCCVGDTIECATRVWNQSDEVEEFQIRVAQNLIPVVGSPDRPEGWHHCLKYDSRSSSKTVRVQPQSISDELEPFLFKPEKPGLYAVFSMALRLSNVVYKHNDDWRFSDHHQWHLLLVKP